MEYNYNTDMSIKEFIIQNIDKLHKDDIIDHDQIKYIMMDIYENLLDNNKK